MSSTFPASLVEAAVQPGRPPMLQAEPRGDAAGWVSEHRDRLRAIVAEHGSLLIRGLRLADPVQVTGVFQQVASDLMVEQEAFAPRRLYADRVYASTPWPPNQQMCMHHELSYRLEVPGLMLFACLVAPDEGGSTGLADAPAVLAALPAELVARFEREGWQLVRTFNDEIGASWAEAFGVGDRAALEAYCRSQGIAVEWRADGGLRTRQRRAAVVAHPVTGRRCWFNQVAFLNEWTLAPEVREYLVDEYGEDGLPFTTRLGDGTPIGEDVVALLNEVYEAHTVREPWRAGDLMLVDNIRTAHDRQPYTGAREVLVGLADPVRPTPAGTGAGR